MDLETENRIAKALLEEARRRRMEADKEGVQAYLRQPAVRARPNSRFLSATVLGVQQANRAVEVNEMWRAREKEKELENKNRSRSKERSKYHTESSKGSTGYRSACEKGNNVASCSSRDLYRSDCYSDNGPRGLQDDEIEKFLHSRVKRGRGEIGSRMDEPGPYLPVMHDDSSNLQDEDNKRRRVVGPEKPGFLKSSSEKSSKEDNSLKDEKKKKKKEKTEKHKHKKHRKDEKSKHSHKRRRNE